MIYSREMCVCVCVYANRDLFPSHPGARSSAKLLLPLSSVGEVDKAPSLSLLKVHLAAFLPAQGWISSSLSVCVCVC